MNRVGQRVYSPAHGAGTVIRATTVYSTVTWDEIRRGHPQNLVVKPEQIEPFIETECSRCDEPVIDGRCPNCAYLCAEQIQLANDGRHSA